ncbi:hypothetical protein R1sor_011650 [Riccia sorocarpa]|uniref:F-box domain-containing protein n=1 Tax=Riccia sorocarpa TaxID=122646 RepID=A0ABD3I4Y2_9MARC
MCNTLERRTRLKATDSTSAIACARSVKEEEREYQEFNKTTMQGKDFTFQIPDECLSCIFEKLGSVDRKSCSLVCKRWHWVEGQGRQRLSLFAQENLLTALSKLLSRFEHVTKLALKCDKKLTSVDDKALFIIGRDCRQLKKLKLKGCKQLTDDGMELFARVCGPLKKISCGSCGFGARGLNSVLQHCVNLEDLTVKRLKGLYEGPSELIRPGCGKIRRLCLKELFNAQLFGPLLAGSKHLHTLMLSKNSGNWDKLLDIITEHLPELVELQMEKLQLSDRGLQAVARCKNLEVLYVLKAPECTNVGLTAVATGCRKLRKLHVDGWKTSRVGDEGLLSVARACKDLQELVLIGLNTTVVSLSPLATGCLGLERLALCNSETFGDPEFSCIAGKCLSLKKLCIKSCPISDQGMEVLATGFPNLVKVKIKKCRGVTSASVDWLQNHRESLIVTVDDGLPSTTRELARSVPLGANRAPGRSALQNRSPLAKARLAIVAGGSFVACTLLRWSSSSGSGSSSPGAGS